MYCKILRTKMIPFFLAFLVGLISANFFLKEDLYNKDSFQQVSPVTKEISIPKTPDCYSSNLEEPFHDKFLNDIYKEHLKEKSNLEIWLKQHPDSPESQKNIRLKKILNINNELNLLLEIVKGFDKTFQPDNHNLLYTEKCYGF